MEKHSALVSTHGISLLQSDLHALDLPSTQPTVVSHAPQVEVKPGQMSGRCCQCPTLVPLPQFFYPGTTGHLVASTCISSPEGALWPLLVWLVGSATGFDSPVAALSQ